MATTLKNKNIFPSPTTLTTLYTCPAVTTTVVSSLVICNQSATTNTFRVALQPSGVTIASSHYLYYDLPIIGNDTFIFTGGITLSATDILSVYANSSGLSFNMFFQENT